MTLREALTTAVDYIRASSDPDSRELRECCRTLEHKAGATRIDLVEQERRAA